MNRRVMVGLALAVALVVPLAGCAGKAKLSGTKMCAAAGGRWNAQTHTCDGQAQSRKGAEMCQAHGGYWDANAGVCEVGLE
jgi:hypothetical protein